MLSNKDFNNIYKILPYSGTLYLDSNEDVTFPLSVFEEPLTLNSIPPLVLVLQSSLIRLKSVEKNKSLIY